MTRRRATLKIVGSLAVGAALAVGTLPSVATPTNKNGVSAKSGRATPEPSPKREQTAPEHVRPSTTGSDKVDPDSEDYSDPIFFFVSRHETALAVLISVLSFGLSAYLVISIIRGRSRFQKERLSCSSTSHLLSRSATRSTGVYRSRILHTGENRKAESTRRLASSSAPGSGGS